MKYRIVNSEAIFIIGIKAETNYQNMSQVTPQLAKQFMPRLEEVTSRKNTFTLSLQNYKRFNIKNFNPNEKFEKWIGVEVTHLNNVPDQMNSLTIASGRYLVVDFKGTISQFFELWQHIHKVWIPNSKFELANRPHFERLPSSYDPMQQVNEEEIWVPIR